MKFDTELLDVRGLRVDRVRPGRARNTVVASVDLSVAEGETVGIVGESGSGKSMTARAIVGLLPPTLVAAGDVLYRGLSLVGLREREWRNIRGAEIGLVMQDPFTMLNPVIRCGTILEESLPRVPRLTRKQRKTEAIRRLAEVGITDASVIERYPFQLSGGMRQRVGIAAALARDPALLIADEPSTALDVTTQREILALLRKIQAARGMGLILITHDLRVAFSMCDRVYVMYAGSLLEVAPAAALEDEPLHPYSHGLLLSEPPADRRVQELISIPGAVPTPDDVSGSCAFAQRCRWSEAVCREARPSLLEVAPGRFSACVRIADVRAELTMLRQRVLQEGAQGFNERPDAPLLRVQNVTKVFRMGNRTVRALNGVSLQLGANESVGIVGESGSGKTTLARILVGLERPTGGEVLIDGIDAANWSALSRSDRRKLRGALQIVFQDPYSSLNPMRTIGATLTEAIRISRPGAKRLSSQVEQLLGTVGLPPGYATRKPVALSGGERQRVAIARALAVEPKVLICDEPVSALDVSVQAQILNLLQSLREERGLGYLFITHDLSIVRQIADYVYVLLRGDIVESGPTERVLDHPQDEYTAQLIDSVPRSEPAWLG
jgi:peptide/nickel transport system ATP-binding protein